MNKELLFDETKELIIDETAIVGGTVEIPEIISETEIEFNDPTSRL